MICFFCIMMFVFLLKRKPKKYVCTLSLIKHTHTSVRTKKKQTRTKKHMLEMRKEIGFRSHNKKSKVVRNDVVSAREIGREEEKRGLSSK